MPSARILKMKYHMVVVDDDGVPTGEAWDEVCVAN
jgi:hypothetical protein